MRSANLRRNDIWWDILGAYLLFTPNPIQLTHMHIYATGSSDATTPKHGYDPFKGAL